MKIRMLRDSREGNPSKGVPIRTVVPAGAELDAEGPHRPDRLFPHGFYTVTFPDGSRRAVDTRTAEVVSAP